MDLMSVFGGSIVTVASGVAVYFWNKNKGKTEAVTGKVISTVETKLGVDIPASWEVRIGSAARGIVAALDVAFSNKKFWGLILGKLRQGHSEDAIQLFLEEMAKVDWSKSLAEQLPPQVLAMYRTAREALAMDGVKQEVALQANIVPDDPSVKMLQEVVDDPERLKGVIKAAVAVNKIHSLTLPEDKTSQPVTQELLKACIEESKARQAKLRESLAPK